jgi:hypothetical protein
MNTYIVTTSEIIEAKTPEEALEKYTKLSSVQVAALDASVASKYPKEYSGHIRAVFGSRVYKNCASKLIKPGE